MATAVTTLVALGFGLWLGGIWPSSQVAALTSAGVASAWGLPVTRLVVNLSALGTIGMLATAVLLPREGGGLGGVARRCLRTAAYLAVAWGVAGAAMLAFAWSNVTGLPVHRMPPSVFLEAGPVFPEAVPYLFGAVLALVIAAAAGMTQTSRGAFVILLLAVYNLLPLTTQGHAQHSAITAYALTIHVAALALWVGGLAGLLIHVRNSPALLAIAVPRFSTLALACFAAVAASGITMVWANLGPLDELWGSRYGLLVLCKATGLAMLGVFGWWHRRRTLPGITGPSRPGGRARRAFVRLAAVEIAVMAATVALGVSLAASPAPDVNEKNPHLHGVTYQQPS